jgi:hypothetical protein
MNASQQLTAPTSRAASSGAKGAIIGLCLVDAALLVWSGVIHIHLWNIAYRHVTIGHLNVLFLIQAIAALVGALAILLIRRPIIAAGNALLMAGTITGFLIARYRSAGLFGFKLGESTSDAKWALAVEIAAVVTLLLTALVMWRSAKRAT